MNQISYDNLKQKDRIRKKIRKIEAEKVGFFPETVENNESIHSIAIYRRRGIPSDNVTYIDLLKPKYLEMVRRYPGWKVFGFFEDTPGSDCGMRQMLRDCISGRIDLVFIRSVQGFAGSIQECFTIIETLKNLPKPVGVLFEIENLYTLDNSGCSILEFYKSLEEDSPGFAKAPASG